MDLHIRTNHSNVAAPPAAASASAPTLAPPSPAPSAPVSKSTIDKFEMDPDAPYPEVQKYYDVKVQGLKTHNFGTRFIKLRITFNNLEDHPLLEALEIVNKILENIFVSLTRNAADNDLVRFILTSDQISYPIEVQFLTKEVSSVE